MEHFLISLINLNSKAIGNIGFLFVTCFFYKEHVFAFSSAFALSNAWNSFNSSLACWCETCNIKKCQRFIE